METKRARSSPRAAQLTGGLVVRNRPIIAIVRLLVLIALLSAPLLVGPSPVRATNHVVIMDEVMAGFNGDATIQFVEMRMADSSQNAWGPQGGESSSRAKLDFFNASGTRTGEFFFPSNPPGGTNRSVLIATQAFANLSGAPAPDFIIQSLIRAGSGKVCFRGNPANPNRFPITLCLSYGNFTGNTEGAGTPAAALPTPGASSLKRVFNLTFFGSGNNADFALDEPAPTNSAGATVTITTEVNLSGRVMLQGRSATFPSGVGHGIATVTRNPGNTTVSVAADGTFQFVEIPIGGTFTLTASAPGYVSRERRNVVVGLIDVAVPPTGLRAGLVNSDAVVNVDDISATVAAFGSSLNNRVDAQGRFVDINGDGFVNINDISAVVSSFGLSSPMPWP